jgi:hypothetical protein
MEMAMANLIFPESSIGGLRTTGEVCGRLFIILGKNKIPRTMITSTNISCIPENIHPPIKHLSTTSTAVEQVSVSNPIYPIILTYTS